MCMQKCDIKIVRISFDISFLHKNIDFKLLLFVYWYI